MITYLFYFVTYYLELVFLDELEMSSMSGNDYLKFLVEELTTYMNKPSKNKKTLKRKPSLSMDQLFGIIPFALKTFFTKNSR